MAGMNEIQGQRGKGRYLFDRMGVCLCLVFALAVATLAIVLIPFDNTYLEGSGAGDAYITPFIAMAVAAIAILILGLFYNAMVWMEGAIGGVEAEAPRSRKLAVSSKRFFGAVFSRDFAHHFRIFLSDALLLRKLWRISKTRWLFHALILFGFIGTLLLDIVTVVCMDILHSQQFIEPLGWGKLWIRDFGFEFFGLMLMIGLLAAAGRRLARRSKQLVTGREDVVSLLFLLIVVISGFVLEGVAMKSAIPGHESPEIYSFVGAAFAGVLPPISAQAYAQLWFVHAAISFAFIAYIPFSKLFHLFAAPLAIQLEAIVERRAGR